MDELINKVQETLEIKLLNDKYLILCKNQIEE